MQKNAEKCRCNSLNFQFIAQTSKHLQNYLPSIQNCPFAPNLFRLLQSLSLFFYIAKGEKFDTSLPLPSSQIFRGCGLISYISQFFFLSISLCTPTSLSIFLILFSRHFLWTDKETFLTIKASQFENYFLFPLIIMNDSAVLIW